MDSRARLWIGAARLPTLPAAITPVLLDRTRGELVPLSDAEIDTLLRTGVVSGNESPDRGALASAASAAIDRARSASPAAVDADTVLVFLGAVWINDALMLAETLGMRPLPAHCHHGLGTLYAKTGRQEQARSALATAIALYRAMEMTFWLPQA